VLKDCFIQSNSLCKKPLTIWLDEGCRGHYQWTDVKYEGRDKIVRPIPVAEMCCNPELSTNGGVFELVGFAVGTAGADWENSEQQIYYNITSVSTRPVARDVALTPEGTLTFKAVADVFGSSDFDVTIRDSSNKVARKTFTIEILKRNQGPHLQVHMDYRTFQGAGSGKIENAVYNINAGRAFNLISLSSEPPAESFHDCKYQPDQQDQESAQQIVDATVGVDRPNLFDLANQGFPRLVLNGSCASLVFVTSKLEFGDTRMTLSVKDSEGIWRSKLVIFRVLPVNTAPTFRVPAKITVTEDNHCRKAFQLYSQDLDKIDGDWFAISGCPYAFPNFATQLRAGGFEDEMCTNCPDSPPCADPNNCKRQRVTFVLDDVTEPVLFHNLPSLDLNGTLRFSLQPDASGLIRVVFRLDDDGKVWNEESHSWSSSSTISDISVCSVYNTLPCGPGIAPGRTLAERGTNTSKPVEFYIEVIAANEPPSFTLNRRVECLLPHADFDGPGNCICPPAADSFLNDSHCRVMQRAELDAGETPGVKVYENSGPHKVLNFVPQVGVTDSVHARASMFNFDRLSGNLSFDSTRKDPILGAPGLDTAAAFAVSPDQAHVYTADFASNTLTVLDHAEGDTKMQFLDRHGHGEVRVRLERHQTLTTNNPCKAALVDRDDKVEIALASGCEDIRRSKEMLPGALAGDVMGLTSADFRYGTLWKKTVGFWQMSAHFFTGRRTRPRIYNTLGGCFEAYDTDYTPSAVLDSTGNLPAAVMQAAPSDRYYACKQNTESDVPIGQQPTLYTYAASDGNHEAVQFDGRSLNGLWVTNDLDSIMHLMPKIHLSIELWFTISAAQEEAAGLMSASHEVDGWILQYAFGAPCTVGISQDDCDENALNVIWKVTTGDSKLTTLRCDTIVNFKKFEWSHIVAMYDGHSAQVYFNGRRIGYEEICADEVCPLKYPECDYDGAGKCRKTSALKYPAALVLGAYDMGSVLIGHIGMIKSARLYNATLSPDEIVAAYDAGKASGLGTISPSYWVKTTNDEVMIPSPGTDDQKVFLFSDENGVHAPNITVMGRFNVSLKYRIRFSVPGYYIESEDCIVQNAISLDGAATCSMQTDSDLCQSAPYCCDKELDSGSPDFGQDRTRNQLLCTRPNWYMGYKASVMTVMESAECGGACEAACATQCNARSNLLFSRQRCTLPGFGCPGEQFFLLAGQEWIDTSCMPACRAKERWGETYSVLWQRACMDKACGFLSTQELSFRKTLLSNTEALWWMSGLSQRLTNNGVVLLCANAGTIKVGCTYQDPAVIRWEVINPAARSWYFNRGDPTRFLWKAPSYYSVFDKVGAQFDTVSNGIDFALGASAFKVFTSVTNKEYVAVANFWDGLSSTTLSCIAEFDPTATEVSIVSIIPTQSATAWEHFQLPSSSGTMRDYLALASYSGASDIIRFDLDSGKVSSLSLAATGQGYVPGILQITGTQGSGFRALFGASDVTTQVPLASRVSWEGGNMRCTDPFTCMQIVSNGYGFQGVPFTSLADSQLMHVDPDCPQICNPYIIEPNCTRRVPSKCFQKRLIGTVEPYYTYGCAREDFACENMPMSKSITKVHLSPVSILPGKNTQASLKKIGHTHNCFRPGILQDSDPLRPNGEKVTITYDTNDKGQIVDVYFLHAGGHGKNYDALPRLEVSDPLCRCGTTVTELEILDPGEEYSSGYLFMSGPGSQFSATYDVQGNISQTVSLGAGGGFSVMPQVSIHVDGRYESGGLGASAVALLGIKSIIIARRGTPYSRTPVVEIDPPTTQGGVQATARVILAPAASGTNVSYIDRIEVLNAGLGYISIPTLKIKEHHAETRRYLDANGTIDVNNTLNNVDAVGIPVMEVKKVMPNHEFNFDKLSYAEKIDPALMIVREQRKSWFHVAQNSKYEMPLSGDRQSIVGIDLEIEMQHIGMISGNSTISEVMEFLCDDCLFHGNRSTEAGVGGYSSPYLATEDMYAQAGFTKNNSAYLRSIPPFDPNRTEPVVLNFTLFEPLCVELCVKTPECVAVDIGKDFDNQGQCWIHVQKSGDPDGLWRNKTAARSFKGPGTKGCRSNSTWHDVFGRNCTDLVQATVCPVNASFVNQNWSSIMRNDPNFTFPYRINPTMSFTGDELKDTACNHTNCSGYVTGYEACCECGKVGPGFRSYIKRHAPITMPVHSAVDLLCRPSTATGLQSDVDECAFPFTNFTVQVDVERYEGRCCYDPTSQVVFVSIIRPPQESGLNEEPTVLWSMLLQEVRFNGWINHTNEYWSNQTDNSSLILVRNATQNFVRNDSLILQGIGTPKSKIGRRGQTICASISPEMEVAGPAQASAMPMLAASRPIVTGKIARLKQARRGTNYTDSTKLSIHPKERADYHDDQAALDAQFKFRHAIIRHAVGFSGSVPGVFDGSNINAMCSVADSSKGLCSRTSPYGQGFGPCVGMTRASGASVLASTAGVDLQNVTTATVEGATDVLLLQLDGEQYLVYSAYFNRSEFLRLLEEVPGQDPFSFMYPAEVLDAAHKTKSPMFRIEVGQDDHPKLHLVQEFDTYAAHDVNSYVFDGKTYVIFANERGPISPLFSWSPAQKRFVLVQRVPTFGARSLTTFQRVVDGEQVLFGLLAQTDVAKQCLLDDQLTAKPLCGDDANKALYDSYDMAGVRAFGASRTIDSEEGRSLMLRWNGTMWQDVPNPKTLSQDLSGGQAFTGFSTTTFIPMKGHVDDFTLFFSSEDPYICEDVNATYCDHVGKSGTCFTDVHGLQTFNYYCDVCPKTCGSCSACNIQYHNSVAGTCEDTEDLKSLNLGDPKSWTGRDPVDVNNPECSDWLSEAGECIAVVANCLACPKTCNLCGICSLENIMKAGGTYGRSRILHNSIQIAKTRPYLPLRGLNSVVVSPDGRHVYAGGYYSRLIVAFDRSPSTGLLVYRPDLNGNGSYTVDGFEQDRALPLAVCEHGYDCSELGYGRPYQGLTHLAMSPDGQFMYTTNFLGHSVSVLRRNASGALTHVQTVKNRHLHGSRIVDGLAGASSIFLSYDNKSVYVSGYTDQSLVAFSRDPDQGTLEYIDRLKNGERRFEQFHVDVDTPAHERDPPRQFPKRLQPEASRKAKYFNVDGKQYLALVSDVSMDLEVKEPTRKSYLDVLIWIHDDQSFTHVCRKSIDHGAVDMESIYVVDDDGRGAHYLVISFFEYRDDWMLEPLEVSTAAVNVYRWHDAAQELVFHHNIPQTHPGGEQMFDALMVPSGIRAFVIGQQIFLAVAYHKSSRFSAMQGTYDVPSYIYVWNHDGQRSMEDGTVVSGFGFEAFQRVSGSTGATDFAYTSSACHNGMSNSARALCVEGSVHFLAMSAFGSPSSLQSRGVIWRFRPKSRNFEPDNMGLWNNVGAAGYFEKITTLATIGSSGVIGFNIPAGGTFFGWSQRQLDFNSIDATDIENFGSQVVIWRLNDENKTTCNLANEYCFVKHQVIDGISVDDQDPVAPGRTVLDSFDRFKGASQTVLESFGGMTMRMLGATALSFFEGHGEYYLGVAQSMCPLYGGTRQCVMTSVSTGKRAIVQPKSSVLQWNRVLQRFTEMLSITDSENMFLRGEKVSDVELRSHHQFHSFALRLPLGIAMGWESFEVMGRTERHNMSLLVVSSMSKGTILYNWDFNVVRGLNGSSAVAALMPMHAFDTDSTGNTILPEKVHKVRTDGSPGEMDIRRFMSVPLHVVSAGWVPNTSRGELNVDSIYTYAELDNSLSHFRRIPRVDHVGNTISNLTLERRWTVAATKEAGASDDMTTHVVEGLSGPSYIRVFNVPIVYNANSSEHQHKFGLNYESGTIVYDQQLGVVSKGLATERMCGFLSHGACQAVSFQVTLVSGHPSLLVAPPEVTPDGHLRFTPKRFAVGNAKFRIEAKDAGFPSQPTDVRLSHPQYFEIGVAPVNNAPHFDPVNVTAGMSLPDDEDTLQHLVFAVNVTPGVSLRYSELGLYGEAGRMRFSYTYVTHPPQTNLGASIFVHEPELNVSIVDDRMVGIMTFKTKPYWLGTIQFDVVLDDHGENDELGNVTGSKSASQSKQFDLTVAYRNTKPYVQLKQSVYALMGRIAPNPEKPDIINAVDMPDGSLKHMVFPFKATEQVCSVTPCCPYGDVDTCIQEDGMLICDDRQGYEECLSIMDDCLMTVGRRLICSQMFDCAPAPACLNYPYCRSTAKCPKAERDQTLKFHVVKARKLSGNFKGSDDDILKNGGGAFPPPKFTWSCDPTNLVATKQRYLALWNNTDNYERFASLNLLNVSGHKSSASHATTIAIEGVDAITQEQERLTEIFCEPCIRDYMRCFGKCLGESCHLHCNDDMGNGGNCDGKCVKPDCSGKLDVFAPHFPNSNTSDAVGWDDNQGTTGVGMVFVPLPDVYGELELTVVVQDDGGRRYNGQDTWSGTFILKLIHVNEGPTFAAHKLRLLESSVAFVHRFPGMITASNGFREDQNLSFAVEHVADHGLLFQTPPVIRSDGALEFTLRPFRSGSARMTVVAFDDGGAEFEGIYNTTCQIDVNVLPVNQKPIFHIPSTVFLVEDYPIRVPRFTRGLSKGSPSEYWQTLKFQVFPTEHIPAHDALHLFASRNCTIASQCRQDRCVGEYWSREDVVLETPSDTALHFSGFEVLDACNGTYPQISHEGELTMRPARDQHGVALFDVVVQDDGGTAYGGQDTSTASLIVKVLPQPRVWGVTPRIGSIRGGNVVTIRGQYFGSTYSRGYVSSDYAFASVMIGGLDCLEHRYISDSEILCRPAPAVGSGAVVVAIDDPGKNKTEFLGTRERTGALVARLGYRYAQVAFGGSERPQDPTDMAHGLLGFGPSVHSPGTTASPAPSMDPVELLLPSAITALSVHDGAVYVGGSFESLTVPESGKLGENKVIVNRIARYDGNEATPLGAGTNGEINIITTFQGLLAMGGAFTEVYPQKGAAIPTGGLAFWNTERGEWSQVQGMPTGTFPGVVMALAAEGSMLAVGGKFDRFSPSTRHLNGVAMYNSVFEKWMALGEGVSGGDVLALLLRCSPREVDRKIPNATNGTESSCAPGSSACNAASNRTVGSAGPCNENDSLQLYVGGTFSKAGSKEAQRLALWEGSEWTSIGNLNGDVLAFAHLSGWLYVGGAFTEVQYGKIGTHNGKHLDVDHVARYRDGIWEALGSGVGGPVYALASIKGCIYVGGSFDRVCKSKVLTATRAHRCAQEIDSGNFQKANSAARMCYGTETAQAFVPEWEPITTHGRQELKNFATVRVLASLEADALA